MSEPSSMAAGSAGTADVATLADQLRPAMLKLSRQLRREAQKAGLSALDAQLLALVKRQPGTGVSELAALERMSRPAMSAHVKRLMAAGWLVREADASGGDRRRVRLVLSAKGEETFDIVRRSRTDWLVARLKRLDETDRRALAAAIDPLVRLAEMEF